MKTLVLVLMACGPGPAYHYATPCFDLDSEVELDQRTLERDTEAAAALVDGFFRDGQFCRSMRRTHVTVRGAEWSCPGMKPGGCIGYFNSFSGIDLNETGKALVHESLHLRDADRLCPGTAWHEGWETNGYNFLDDRFREHVKTWRMQ